VKTRALRFAALAVAATSLAGCVIAPALVPSDDPSPSPRATRTDRLADVKQARVALAAAVQRLSVVNEGSYTLWLTAKEPESRERTYFMRTKTQYDLSRGLVTSEIDVGGGTVKVRIIESKGAFVKIAFGAKGNACWYRTSVKGFKSLPGLPFAYDLEKGSAFARLVGHARAVSIKPEPHHPDINVVRVRSSVLEVLKVALPAVAGQFAYDVKGIKGDTFVDVHLYGSEVTALDFDLAPVLDGLDDVGLADAADLPELGALRAGKPRGHMELGDLKASFDVEVPKSVCAPGAAPPDFSDV
jgi:hypothetical protein